MWCYLPYASRFVDCWFRCVLPVLWVVLCDVCEWEEGGGYLVLVVLVLLFAICLCCLLSSHMRSAGLVLGTVVSYWAAGVRCLVSPCVRHCGRGCSLKL